MYKETIGFHIIATVNLLSSVLQLFFSFFFLLFYYSPISFAFIGIRDSFTNNSHYVAVGFYFIQR